MKFTHLPLSLWLLFFITLSISSFAYEQNKEISVGYLKGAEITAEKPSPLVLIIPGSGPTDRDGNISLGMIGIYKHLANDLFKIYKISSVRVDKRGMFSSKAPEINPNTVTMHDYAKDTRLWIDNLRTKTNIKCVWLLGHSQGGLTALLAAQQPKGICGLILIATPGRKVGDLLRERLMKNPNNLFLMPNAIAVIEKLEKGQSVNVEKFPLPLQYLFHPRVRDFIIDQMRYDPAKLIANISLPILILQGDYDIQVSVKRDARKLHEVAPQSKLVILSNVTHVLKLAKSPSLEDNYLTYVDPSIPISKDLIQAIGEFIESN